MSGFPFAGLALTWQLSDVSGWGVFGFNLTAELLRRGAPSPLLLSEPDLRAVDPLSRAALAPLIAQQREIEAGLAAGHGRVGRLDGVAMLHHLGNGLHPPPISRRIEGSLNAGMVFLESTDLDGEALAVARTFDVVLAGSTWNAEILRQRGLERVEVALQGVDTALFRPPPTDARRLLRQRFVVFSGGKLELRKGQDIVVAAFRRFCRRHPDALLVTLWHNHWPRSSDSLRHSPHVDGAPRLDSDGRQRMAAWALDNAIPADNFLDLGVVPNAQLPAILHSVDAAVFPNRCEGGTNLVAMECMAAGVPCVLSANTGHRDLIGADLVGPERCFALEDQGPVSGPGGGTEGWGESSVEELEAALETLYTDRAEAARRAAAGAAFMAGWSWRTQVERLLAHLAAAAGH